MVARLTRGRLSIAVLGVQTQIVIRYQAVRKVNDALRDYSRDWLLGFRDITNATNERTAIFTLFCKTGIGHSMPILFVNAEQPAYLNLYVVSTINSIPFDYFARQKVGGTHLTYHYLNQLPIIRTIDLVGTESRAILSRTIEMVYTSWDIKPLADDVWREADGELRKAIEAQWEENKESTGGHTKNPPDWVEIAKDGIPLPPFKWDEDRRARLRAELDAIYAKLYGLNRKQLRYILDPADLTEKELENILDDYEEVDDPLDKEAYLARCEASTFPGETFRVLKKKEIKKYGHYRTRRLVLEAWIKGKCRGSS